MARFRRDRLFKMRDRIRKATRIPAINDLFSGLPDDWVRCSIADAGITNVGRQRAPQYLRGLSPVPYIRAANITLEGLDVTNLESMDFSPAEIEHFALKVGDVLLTEASGSPEHVGRSVVWNGEVSVCCFQNTVLRFRSTRVIPEFACAVFGFLQRAGAFKSAARGVGIQHLSLERFKQLPFPLAPISAQKVTVLRLQRHLRRLKRARGRVLQALKTLQSQKAAMTSEVLFSLKDAQAVPLGDVCEVYNGRAFKSSEWGTVGLPIIRIQNLKAQNASFNYFAGQVDIKHQVNPGDLLFAWSGTPETSFGAHLWSGPRAVLNQHIFKLVPDISRVDVNYLYAVLTSLVPAFISQARGGGGLAHLNRRDFISAVIPVPSPNIQHAAVERLRDLAESHNRQSALLSSVLDRISDLEFTVLDKACTGSLSGHSPAKGASGTELLKLLEADQRQVLTAKARQSPLASSRTVRAAQSRTPLVTILRTTGPQSAQSLMAVSGYRYDLVEDVDSFYAELTKSLAAGEIVAADRGFLAARTEEVR